VIITWVTELPLRRIPQLLPSSMVMAKWVTVATSFPPGTNTAPANAVAFPGADNQQARSATYFDVRASVQTSFSTSKFRQAL